MDEIVKAVGELWATGLVLLGFVVVILFRDQLRDRISKGGFRLKHRDTSIEVDEADSEVGDPGLIPDTQDSSASDEQPDRAVGESEMGTEVKDAAEPNHFVSMLIHSSRGRWSEAEAAYDRALAACNSDRESDELRVDYLGQLARYRSDGSAIEELRELSKDSDVADYALSNLGHCYNTAGQHDTAAEVFVASARKSQDPSLRAARFGSAAEAMQKLGRTDEAVALLEDSLREMEEPQAQSKLLEKIAWLHQESGDKHKQMVALEAALETRPADADIHFALAYGQNNDLSSLLHYDALLRLDRDYVYGNNNMGVTLDQLKLPLSAVDHYKKAANRGDSLAMANLANLLRSAGFGDEALQWIERAESQDSPHENVASARTALVATRQAEQKRLKNLQLEAGRRRSFYRQYGKAYYFGSGVEALSGDWTTADGEDIHIRLDSDGLFAEWDQEGRRELRATIHNESLVLRVQKEGWNFGSTAKVMTYDWGGRGYFSDQMTKITVLVTDGESSCEKVFRVPDSTSGA